MALHIGLLRSGLLSNRLVSTGLLRTALSNGVPHKVLHQNSLHRNGSFNGSLDMAYSTASQTEKNMSDSEKNVLFKRLQSMCSDDIEEAAKALSEIEEMKRLKYELKDRLNKMDSTTLHLLKLKIDENDSYDRVENVAMLGCLTLTLAAFGALIWSCRDKT